jgi:hypothetical protein
MTTVLKTAFVLGAGFSVEEQYPLVRSMKEQVLHFLEAERHSAYWTFMKPGNGGYDRGQFYAGLDIVDPEKDLQFEELLIALASRVKKKIFADPCHITAKVLRIGAARLLWTVHNFIWEVTTSYKNFAAWLGMNELRHGVISFNWDLQAELLLTQASVPWSYSTGSAGVPIIKPHGSITWSGHLRKRFVPEYTHWQSIGLGSNLSFDSKEPLSNPFKQGFNLDLNYMIFPGDPDLPKTDPDVALLWRDAASVIENAECVVFIGYSIPDYDSYAVRFFKEALQGKKVVAVNPSSDHLQRFRGLFGDAVELRQEKFKECPYGRSRPPSA